MEIKTIITVNHDKRIARKAQVYLDSSHVVDPNGTILENMHFPYSLFEEERHKFKLINDNGIEGRYYSHDF